MSLWLIRVRKRLWRCRAGPPSVFTLANCGGDVYSLIYNRSQETIRFTLSTQESCLTKCT